MEARPRLRQVEIVPVTSDGQQLVALRDPLGLATGLALLPRPAALLAVLCDGQRAPAEIVDEFRRRTGLSVTPAQLDRLLGQLDEGLFLDGLRVEQRRAELLAGYRAAGLREAAHAGGAYPGDAAALRASLDAWRDEVAGEPAPEPLVARRGAPVALIAPHIDYHRGRLTYARAWRALPLDPPDLVVVLGTDHNGADHPFTLTRKSFATPLGPVRTDAALVDELAREVDGAASLFADELHHIGEHSIELQAIWLRHRYGDRAPPMLPVLCGSLHRALAAGRGGRAIDRGAARFLDALRRLIADRRVLVVAGADLAHVGPRFGDDRPLRDHERRDVEAADRRALAAAAAGDAAGFFDAIAGDGDRHRVCGLAPITHALALCGGPGSRGRLLGYEQCPADDAGGSLVSIAALSLAGPAGAAR